MRFGDDGAREAASVSSGDAWGFACVVVAPSARAPQDINGYLLAGDARRSRRASCSYNVLVVGLGSMGAAAARALVARGLRVLGLETFGAAHDQGPRTVARGSSSVLLRGLGVRAPTPPSVRGLARFVVTHNKPITSYPPVYTSSPTASSARLSRPSAWRATRLSVCMARPSCSRHSRSAWSMRSACT
jgi:hypothetical protein